MDNTEVKALELDGEIEDTGSNYQLVEPGTYKFTVTKVDKAKYAGSAKLPPCWKITVTISLDDFPGVYLTNNFYLATNAVGLICQFYESIGLIKRGDKLRMNWGKVVGQSGMAEINHREYNGNKYNNIKKFIPRDSNKEEPKADDSSAWKAGTF